MSSIKRRSLVLFILVASFCVMVVPSVRAADLTERSIAIPTALTNATTSHEFRFTINTVSSVGSISFEYCENSPLPDQPCTPPAGLDVSNVTLDAQSGAIGFSVHSNTTTNRIVISRPALATVPGAASYTFGNAHNPSTANKTTYVRLATYASTDGSGPFTDNGAVAFSVTAGLAVNAFVPPYLALCVGVTVASNCASSDGFGINLGTLRSNQANAGTTQAAVATNDATGYTLSMLGGTMTAGNNIIPPLNNPTASAPGTGQFGINLRDNGNPNVGQDPSGGTGTPASRYNQPNLFTFVSGEIIAASPIPTDFTRYTMSYLVNIPASQPPGTYSTTITYVAMASF